ncbi:hypothetical protein IFT93_22775, partial [Erwinia persicina]
ILCFHRVPGYGSLSSQTKHSPGKPGRFSAMVADELIKNRRNSEFVRQVINDESKIPLVLDTIESSITSLGERVVDDLRDYGHVNRVYIVGGGAPLIEAAVIKAWQRLGSKVVMMASPQTALVEAIALFKGE